MSLNWDDMRVFLAVARQGSLSAAARTLRVTQPTVGRRLRNLEEALGTRLFDRLPDGFVATVAGADLLPLAEEMERTAEALERRQASLSNEVNATIRLSIYEIMAQFLTSHLAELQESLPGIELELAVAHLSANLSKREADLLIRVCLPENPGLITRRLGDLAYAVYGAADLVAARPEAQTPARYKACPWVGFDDDHSYFAGQSWLLAQREGKPPQLRVNNGMVLHDAVRKGVGLGVLPCFAGDGDTALVRLTPPLAEVRSTHHLIVHPDLRKAPGVRAVMDALAHLFKRETPALLGQTDLMLRTA